jgi:hypothetical protein
MAIRKLDHGTWVMGSVTAFMEKHDMGNEKEYRSDDMDYKAMGSENTCMGMERTEQFVHRAGNKVEYECRLAVK